MLASICPLGERARRQRYPVTIGAFVAASTAAGALLGAVLGAAGGITPGLGTGIAGAVTVLTIGAAAGLAIDASYRGRHLPGPRRQVNEDWLAAYRGWVYGAGFGAQLGAGITTYVMVSAIYVVLLGAFVAGSAAAGALVGGVFGLARAVPLFATAGVAEPEHLRRRMRAFQRGLPLAHRAVLAGQGVVALAGLAVLVVG